MGGSLLAAASAGDCRNVKGPCPALRPGRLCGAFRFRELVPCFGPRPAAFNSLRSCSFSPRRRSISLSACFNCSRKPRFSASYSFSCLRRSSCWEPSIAPYRDTKPPKCPAFSANQLPLATVEEAVQKFREYCETHPEVIARIKRELRGLTLSCWCKTKKNPNAPCHGDVLVEIANS